jgi:hypothetical protein
MRVIYLLLIFSFLSTSVFAGEDSILINKIQVKLGMPKETTIGLFSQKYDLQRVEGVADHWVVFEKGSKFKYVGSISFEAGKVISASQNIGTFEGKNTLKFAEALHQALSNLQKSGEVVSVTKTYFQSEGRADSIFFKSSKKAIIVGIASGPDVQESVTIEESLDSRRHK